MTKSCPVGSEEALTRREVVEQLGLSVVYHRSGRDASWWELVQTSALHSEWMRCMCDVTPSVCAEWIRAPPLASLCVLSGSYGDRASLAVGLLSKDALRGMAACARSLDRTAVSMCRVAFAMLRITAFLGDEACRCDLRTGCCASCQARRRTRHRQRQRWFSCIRMMYDVV